MSSQLEGYLYEADNNRDWEKCKKLSPQDKSLTYADDRKVGDEKEEKIVGEYSCVQESEADKQPSTSRTFRSSRPTYVQLASGKGGEL